MNNESGNGDLAPLTEREVEVMIPALDDYVEWCRDAAEDRRNQARDHAGDDGGLLDEAASLDEDAAVAIALRERLCPSEATDG